eukprot:CAMPEP_0183361978 /NCGR_PEP_ID=MMETSP0164_2-20130417/65459_1 /TAXON_ID=221442 /ORGANISM="Coccolithus pelagicus ssp braarudi, Strain PLY182g" /LENGTH=63 /DNA_ID=CAMNT_0025536711 /DNA_START=509 /DNA_END=698 /DNA_ORIENTATION=+
MTQREHCPLRSPSGCARPRGLVATSKAADGVVAAVWEHGGDGTPSSSKLSDSHEDEVILTLAP